MKGMVSAAIAGMLIIMVLEKKLNTQAQITSAPRKVTPSMTFLALYLSSRSAVVNRISRAGLDTAKLAVRWATWKAMTTARTGARNMAP